MKAYCVGLTITVCMLAISAGPAHAQNVEMEYRDGKWVSAARPTVGTPQGELALVRHLFNTNSNASVVRQAKKFMKSYADAPEAEEVLLLAGEAEMRRDMYWQAFGWFEKQLGQFPAGQFAERALLREYAIGDAFLNGKKRVVGRVLYLSAQPEGEEILLKVVDHAPGSVIAERSMLRIADYHFNAKEWGQAADAYDRYVAVFKNSPHASYAMLHAALATYASFGGCDYDDTPLIDAEQRFRNFRQNYPKQAQENNVDQLLQDITDWRARKLFETADFYRRTKHPVAQAYYYDIASSSYPQTRWGARAAQQRAILGDLTPKFPAVVPLTQPAGVAMPATSTAPATEPATSTGPAATMPDSFPATMATTTTSAPATAATEPSTQPVPVERLVTDTQTATQPESAAATQDSQPSSEPAEGIVIDSAPESMPASSTSQPESSPSSNAAADDGGSESK